MTKLQERTEKSMITNWGQVDILPTASSWPVKKDAILKLPSQYLITLPLVLCPSLRVIKLLILQQITQCLYR